jgi:RNA polymerase sigma factor (sigma-70 family)
MMNPDKNAIEAVKQGDRNRFAELVERHKRRVYGIAWSYLGDADLCEDAAQETFIKAFRYLGALRNAERFPAWLSRIARNVSATLLRRRRAELENRKRWQIEQPASVPPSENPDDDENLKDLLGRTLAELSPQHRECLVLFYLEGKSVSEAATLLGITETAFKTRLHRARRVLRGQLEERIEQGLEGLSPRKNFVASVMFLLPAKPLGWVGAGGGASLIGKVGSSLGNLLPSLAFFFWMSLAMLGQTLYFYLVMRWFAHLEMENIVARPENEFRKKILKRNVLTISISALCILIGTGLVLRVFHSNRLIFFQGLAVYGGWGFYQSLLILRVNRSPFVWGQVGTIFFFFISNVWIGFLGGPVGLLQMALTASFFVTLWSNRHLPRRHDYNLFLRQTNGTLGEPEPELSFPRSATEPELRAFARFLGEQYLIRDYSLKGSTLLLRLPPVHLSFLNHFLMSSVGTSWIRMDTHGFCQAFLSPADEKSLRILTGRPLEPKSQEAGVCRVIQGAFVSFQQGNPSKSAHLLSTVEDDAIFITDFSKTRGYRIQYRFGLFCAIGMLICLVAAGGPSGLFTNWSPQPVSQRRARKAVSEWVEENPRDPNFSRLWEGPVHPSLELMGKKNVEAYKRVVAEALKMDFDETSVEWRIMRVLNNSRLLYHAMATPILSESELAALGFTQDKVRETLNEFRNYSTQDPRSLHDGRISVMYAGVRNEFRDIRIEEYVFRLWILKEMGCLDLVDQEGLVRKIASLQITNNFTLPEDFIPIDINQTSGLFHSGHRSLGETWAALWILEMLGKLDQIDREACIQGLLRLHRGKGVFMVYSPFETDKQIKGNEDETFYALESLARLNALDRIPDFQKWEFHPVTHDVTDATLRSWAYQERLEKLQRETLQ